jgi:hypothetical protein
MSAMGRNRTLAVPFPFVRPYAPDLLAIPCSGCEISLLQSAGNLMMCAARNCGSCSPESVELRDNIVKFPVKSLFAGNLEGETCRPRTGRTSTHT